jgi:hypothetical protein
MPQRSGFETGPGNVHLGLNGFLTVRTSKKAAEEFRRILSSGRELLRRQFCPVSLAKIEEKIHRP